MSRGCEKFTQSCAATRNTLAVRYGTMTYFKRTYDDMCSVAASVANMLRRVFTFLLSIYQRKASNGTNTEGSITKEDEELSDQDETAEEDALPATKGPVSVKKAKSSPSSSSEPSDRPGIDEKKARKMFEGLCDDNNPDAASMDGEFCLSSSFK